MKLVPGWDTVSLWKDGCLQYQEIRNTGRPHLGMHLRGASHQLPLRLRLGLPKGDDTSFPFRTEYAALHIDIQRPTESIHKEVKAEEARQAAKLAAGQGYKPLPDEELAWAGTWEQETYINPSTSKQSGRRSWLHNP